MLSPWAGELFCPELFGPLGLAQSLALKSSRPNPFFNNFKLICNVNASRPTVGRINLPTVDVISSY